MTDMIYDISYIISYHIISYHINTYHIISYHIISYHIIYNYTIHTYRINVDVIIMTGEIESFKQPPDLFESPPMKRQHICDPDRRSVFSARVNPFGSCTV